MPLNDLLQKYRQLLHSIEFQTCEHAGQTRTGHDWQYCCGVSYEYFNDLGMRDCIESKITIDKPTLDEMAVLTELDKRLRALLVKNDVSIEGPAFWKNGLPFGVMP